MVDGIVKRNERQAQAPTLIALSGFGPMAAPDGATMHAVHRGPDGFIPLARKRDGEWEELGAISTDAPWLPELLEQLDTEGYFGLGSSWRTGKRRHYTRQVWQSARTLPLNHPEFGTLARDFPAAEVRVDQLVHQRRSPITGLPFAHHRTDALRWLNVCHVDVDCYRKGLSVGDTLGAIVNAQDAGHLPPATGFARSGRGVWAFWFLLDVQNPASGARDVSGVTHHVDTPQRATDRALALYARVQRALADRLAPLGADLGALDAARFAPVPGTLKTDVNARVEWWLQGGPGAGGYAYTLPQLATALGLELSPRVHPVIEAALRQEPAGERATDAVKSAAGRKGWAIRWRRALRDFEILRRLRGGGFDRGVRNRGAFYYALLLSRAPAPAGGHMTAADVAAHLATFGAACRPALPAAEQRHALHQARKAKSPMVGYVSNGWLFVALAVTDVEASFLQTIRPAAPQSPSVTRPADRRAVVHQTIAALGYVPSTREMADLLKTTPQGINVNHTTIVRDYQALDLVTARPQGGHPKRSLF